jgi:hypothetical protein
LTTSTCRSNRHAGDYHRDQCVVTLVISEVMHLAKRGLVPSPRDFSPTPLERERALAGHPLCRSAQVRHPRPYDMGSPELKGLAFSLETAVSAVLKARHREVERPVEVELDGWSSLTAKTVCVPPGRWTI